MIGWLASGLNISALYIKIGLWALLAVALTGSHTYMYMKGKSSIVLKAAVAQVKQSEKDGKKNVERAERVVSDFADREAALTARQKELEDAIEDAKKSRLNECPLTDDELRAINGIVDEANRSVPKSRR